MNHNDFQEKVLHRIFILMAVLGLTTLLVGRAQSDVHSNFQFNTQSNSQSNSQSNAQSFAGAGGACSLRLMVAVRQGPDAGLALAGDITPQPSGSGTFEAVVLVGNSTPVMVSGQIYERAVNLVFILEDGGRLYGVGTMENSLSICQGSGGGTITGPSPADSGEWSGSWALAEGMSQVVPAEGSTSVPAAQSPVYSTDTLSSLLPFVGLACLVVLIMVVVFVIYFLRGRKSPNQRTPSAKRRKMAPVAAAPVEAPVQAQVQQAQRVEAPTGAPMAQFSTTFVAGDDSYDESTNLDLGGKAIGECGVDIAQVLNQEGPKRVIALEVWLFDKSDINTATKILTTRYCFEDPSVQFRLMEKGEMILASPGGFIQLDSGRMTLIAEIVELEFGGDANYPDQYFNKVSLNLSVYQKGAGSS